MLGKVAREFRSFFNSFGMTDGAYGATGTSMSGGTASVAGVSVTDISSLQSPVVFACHRILSGLTAKTPLHVWEKLSGGGRAVALNHPWEYLLSKKANSIMSSFTFKETSMMHLVSRGNSYARLERDGTGRIRGFYPIHPSNCTPCWNDQGGISYRLVGPNGQSQIIAARDILQVANISLDGIIGLSPIQVYAKEAIGLDVGLRAYGARYIAQGGSASIVASFKGDLAPDARADYEKALTQAHSGVNAHRAIVVDNEAKVTNLDIAPEQAQFLQTREFQRDEIAECIYGVPSHLVGGKEETKAGISEQQGALLSGTMSVWFGRWKSAYNSSLFPENPANKWEDGDKYEIDFDTTEMDSYRIMETLKTVSVGRQNSVLTPDEARAMIGKNPYEQTDPANPAKQLSIAVNLVPMTGDAADAIAAAAKATTTQPSGGESMTEATDIAARKLYARVFRDAFNRVTKREKRDKTVVNSAFIAPISAISDYFLMSNDANFRSGSEFPEEISLFVAGYVENMAKRCAEWTTEDSTAQCDAELTRAITEIRKRVCATKEAENE